MLSVIIITKNEEANIKRCLESICWVDEIIIVDSGSTDNTLSIARQYTDKIIINEDWQGYGVQKQRALDHAHGEWVLNLDADESVSAELKNAIEKAMAMRSDAWRIPIQMVFYGQALHYSYSPARHIRLFKRQGAHYSKDLVHEKIVLPASAKIDQLTLPIMHLSFQDLSHALYKMNRYSSYTAHMRLEQKQSTSFLKVLAASTWMFFRCYFLQRGFGDGKAGFLMAVFNAQGTFYRGMKQLYPDSSCLSNDLGKLKND